jgi:hypothetical protein
VGRRRKPRQAVSVAMTERITRQSVNKDRMLFRVATDMPQHPLNRSSTAIQLPCRNVHGKWDHNSGGSSCP